tara:strand:+ start:192 stop:371 length:180 start_codon:yes stop_codon:yes gene_type:complete
MANAHIKIEISAVLIMACSFVMEISVGLLIPISLNSGIDKNVLGSALFKNQTLDLRFRF